MYVHMGISAVDAHDEEYNGKRGDDEEPEAGFRLQNIRWVECDGEIGRDRKRAHERESERERETGR